ncbi:MAG: hypothetical protein ACPLRW_12920 [Moorellales bacterium]
MRRKAPVPEYEPRVMRKFSPPGYEFRSCEICGKRFVYDWVGVAWTPSREICPSCYREARDKVNRLPELGEAEALEALEVALSRITTLYSLTEKVFKKGPGREPGRLERFVRLLVRYYCRKGFRRVHDRSFFGELLAFRQVCATVGHHAAELVTLGKPTAPCDIVFRLPQRKPRLVEVKTAEARRNRWRFLFPPWRDYSVGADYLVLVGLPERTRLLAARPEAFEAGAALFVIPSEALAPQPRDLVIPAGGEAAARCPYTAFRGKFGLLYVDRAKRRGLPEWLEIAEVMPEKPAV